MKTTTPRNIGGKNVAERLPEHVTERQKVEESERIQRPHPRAVFLNLPLDWSRSATMLRWVMITPLGVAVEPEVKTI